MHVKVIRISTESTLRQYRHDYDDSFCFVAAEEYIKNNISGSQWPVAALNSAAVELLLFLLALLSTSYSLINDPDPNI